MDIKLPKIRFVNFIFPRRAMWWIKVSIKTERIKSASVEKTFENGAKRKEKDVFLTAMFTDSDKNAAAAAKNIASAASDTVIKTEYKTDFIYE